MARGPNRNIGAYERLGLLELRVRAVKHQLKKKSKKNRSSVKSTFTGHLTIHRLETSTPHGITRKKVILSTQ